MLEYAKSIRNLANLYRDMEAAAEALESLGSTELRAAEAELRTEKARAELAQMIERQDQARVELKALQDGARGIMQKAEESAKGTLERATLEASARLASAEGKAADIVMQAKDVSKIMLDEADAEFAAKRAVIDDLAKQCTELGAQRDEAQKQLDSVKRRLSDLRTTLGGV